MLAVLTDWHNIINENIGNFNGGEYLVQVITKRDYFGSSSAPKKSPKNGEGRKC